MELVECAGVVGGRGRGKWQKTRATPTNPNNTPLAHSPQPTNPSSKAPYQQQLQGVWESEKKEEEEEERERSRAEEEGMLRSEADGERRQ